MQRKKIKKMVLHVFWRKLEYPPCASATNICIENVARYNVTRYWLLPVIQQFYRKIIKNVIKKTLKNCSLYSKYDL